MNYFSSSTSHNNVVNDEDYQHNIDINVEMHRNSQMIIAENRTFRSQNTYDNYEPRQRDFKVHSIPKYMCVKNICNIIYY